MTTLELLKYRDYKKFLRDSAKANKSLYGYKTRLAEAAGCRASYLSQVFNGAFDLMPEHGLGLSEFWGFSAEERDYFVLLIQLARAGTPQLTKYYEEQLNRISREYERRTLKSDASEISQAESRSLFYSSWHYTAIHDLTTFPGGQTTEAIARRLELPKDLVEQALRALESMQLVRPHGIHWKATVNELIVPTDTYHSAQHISHWTHRAALDVMRPKRPLESFHKCWVFGISPEDFQALRELLLEHIRKAQKIVPNSDRQELVCMNLNLFMV